MQPVRHRLERRWQHTQLTIDKEVYRQQCATVALAIKQAKANFFGHKLESATPRDMFRALQGLVFLPRQGTPGRMF